MHAIFLIARREYLAYVGAWGFWVSLITTPLIMLVFGAAPTLLRNSEPARLVSVIAADPLDAAAIQAGFAEEERARLRGALRLAMQSAPDSAAKAASEAFDDAQDTDQALAAALSVLAKADPQLANSFKPPPPAYIFVDPPARDAAGLAPYLKGERKLGAGQAAKPLFAAMFVERDGPKARIAYWSDNVTDTQARGLAVDGLRERLRTQALIARGLPQSSLQEIDQIRPKLVQFRPGAKAEITTRDRAPFLVAVLLAFVLWMSIFSISNMLLTGVIEEKSNKILDTLLTSVAPTQILAGKLLGVATLSLTLFLIWGGAGSVFLFQAASGGGGLLAGAAEALRDPGLLAIFAISFVLGYVMYGVIFLAIGSLCESLQESQALITPLVLLLVAPMLLLVPALQNPDAPLVVAASWFPLFTPFVLMMRAASGLAWWEAAAPLALTALTALVILLAAGRVFRAGATSQLSIADLRRFLPGALQAKA